MNVRTPSQDSRERVHAYGLALDAQNNILNEMSELMLTMRVIGKTTLLPFQKEMIQSDTAIQLLFHDLAERFGFKYVLSYRLNQDALENTFGLLRSRGGLHDHPDREEFRFRLRSHILGHNDGVLSDAANVSSGDTPDLEVPLTGTIFQSIAWEPKVDENIHHNKDDEELAILENDGLENMAGYICHKLKNKMPIEEDVATSSYTWVDHLSEGGLSNPSPTMMNDLTALDNIFKSFNGEDLVICPGYQKNLLELAKDVRCDGEVKKLFFRARMLFRIRTLNRAIVDSTKSRKRKLNKITT